jgi:hypothetical protein
MLEIGRVKMSMLLTIATTLNTTRAYTALE